MKVNNKEILGDKFAFDGCHKIYIIEDNLDEKEAIDYGYDIYEVKDLKDIYENSCSLKFISNWKLNINYVKQFEEVSFDEENSMEI